MGHSVTQMVLEEEHADDCPVYCQWCLTHWRESGSNIQSNHFEDVVCLCTDQDQDVYHSLWCIACKCPGSCRVDTCSIACHFQLLVRVSKSDSGGLFIAHDSFSLQSLDMDIHLQSFTIPHYHSLMISLSKPAHLAIVYAPTRPVIMFISSWRQYCLTVDDLLLYCTANNDLDQFLNKNEADLQPHLDHISDQDLVVWYRILPRGIE